VRVGAFGIPTLFRAIPDAVLRYAEPLAPLVYGLRNRALALWIRRLDPDLVVISQGNTFDGMYSVEMPLIVHYTGKPFVLEPWQRAIIGSLAGWKRRDGTRRYREMMLFVPRKNGKTPLAAGIALMSLFLDHEIGAMNVCAAGDTKQAALLFRHCKGMIANEPELGKRVQVFAGVGQRAINYTAENSSLHVISSEADTKHGGNGHLAIIDELHVQQNRDLVDVLQTSMASANRLQPLLIHVTTADFRRE
jgi:phage terminase large subunit-like protein